LIRTEFVEGRWLVRIDSGATVGDQRSGDGLTGEFFEVGSGRVSKEAVDGGCVREGEDEHGVGLAGAALDAVDAARDLAPVTGEERGEAIEVLGEAFASSGAPETYGQLDPGIRTHRPNAIAFVRARIIAGTGS
jgi:hypothetical protein